jgi:hypothetical protein
MVFQSSSRNSEIADCSKGRHRSTRVGHVGRGRKPILEAEKQAEDKCCGLALKEEICGQKHGHEPLQYRSTPNSWHRPKPAKQKMPAFVHYQIHKVNKEKITVLRKSISQGKPHRTRAMS